MAHKIAEMLNRAEKRESVPCNETCEYWKFPHLDRACVLSPMFSVRKGEPCYEYKVQKEEVNVEVARLV